jgi:hypothetical protein
MEMGDGRKQFGRDSHKNKTVAPTRRVHTSEKQKTETQTEKIERREKEPTDKFAKKKKKGTDGQKNGH